MPGALVEFSVAVRARELAEKQVDDQRGALVIGEAVRSQLAMDGSSTTFSWQAPVSFDEGTLFDSTVTLFGSGTSDTHIHKNYPIVLAGGGNMGLKHGQFLKYREERPMNDLLLSIAHRFGIDRASFGDSSGEIHELMHA